MLEAALFGGIPDHFQFGPHRFMPPGVDRNFQPIVRPPSPNLAAQRLIREQQVYIWIIDFLIRNLDWCCLY